MRLYLDIETIPSQSPEVHAEIERSITPPGNISKAETIAAWEAEKKPTLVKEAIAKTALDGALGHICCIGFALEDGMPDATYCSAMGVGIEATMIRDFISAVECGLRDTPWRTPTIIGHNVSGFDIRFIWQRAIILGIKMPSWFPRDPKPWDSGIFDTMTAFAGSRGMIGMDKLCRALGMDGKGEIDGSMIGDLWAAGKFDEIASYCRADVERTRAIHRRMMLAFGEAA